MKPTEKNLLEQLQINEVEIARRMQLLDLTNEDIKALVRCQNLINKEIDTIVAKFYEKLTSIEEVSFIIGDSDTLQRLQASLKQYILELFEGFYDLEYVHNRLRIGLVHKRIGVEPKYYLAAVKALKSILCNVIQNGISSSQQVEKIVTALDKLIFLDIEFVFDTYIGSLVSELRAAKNKAELYAISLEKKVTQRTRELEELTRKDSLTDLFNRRAFMEYLRKYIANSKRQKSVLSIIYFDVDNFKQINDTKGHSEGDYVLSTISDILRGISREADIPSRYGGDEFCILLPNTDSHNAKNYAFRIIERFTKTFQTETLSIGISETGPESFISAQELIAQADSAMYKAKESADNQMVSFLEVSESLQKLDCT